MSSELPLLITRRGPVLIATLNRPDKLNALNDELMRQLAQAVDFFREAPDARVMLLRATGRYFSAGADLVEGQPALPTTASGIREQHRRETRGMSRLFDEMEAIEKPIVVAHQATCLGGALEMSLSCDFRLAAADTRYGFPEGRFGVLPAANGVSRLTRLLGTHWARYMLMANIEIDAAKALSIGLVHEVYDAHEFESRVVAFCDRLAMQDPEHMGAAKLAIEMSADLGLSQARNVERMANSALMLGLGFAERRQAYVDRNVGRRSPDAS